MKSFKPTRIFEVTPRPPPPPRKRPQSSDAAPAKRRAAPSSEQAPKRERPPPAPQQPPRPRVEGPPFAPIGDRYLFTIDKASLFDKPKLGQGLEIVFSIAEGEHRGCIAHGLFPFAKPGLAVLVAAALGEPLAQPEPSIGERLCGAKILAGVVRSGGENGVALVRNIRPAEPATATPAASEPPLP